MPAQLTLLVVILLTCLSGVGAFALFWPRDISKPRPFRTWPLTLLVLGVSAPAIIAIPIYRAEFLTDNALPWLEWGFAAACLTSLALAVAAVVGDRSRGRRRCPKCWYDMAGAPGLTCPECGNAARVERRLFRARRRKLLVVLALIPAIAATIPWNAMFYRDRDWAKKLSNTALVLGSVFIKNNATLDNELAASAGVNVIHGREFSSWQRRVLIHGARRNLRDPALVRQSLLGAEVLIGLSADDEATTDALVAIAEGTGAYKYAAMTLLGHVRAGTPAAKSALLRIVNTDPNSWYNAAVALEHIMPREPGGPAPPTFLKLITSKAAMGPQLAYQLRYFDASAESRAALLSVLDEPPFALPALGSLAALWPRDPEVQSIVLDSVRLPAADGAEPPDPFAVAHLVFYDQQLRVRHTRLPADRLALYTPEICAELEKWLPVLGELDRDHMRDTERSYVTLLRRTLDDVRAGTSSNPNPNPR